MKLKASLVMMAVFLAAVTTALAGGANRTPKPQPQPAQCTLGQISFAAKTKTVSVTGRCTIKLKVRIKNKIKTITKIVPAKAWFSYSQSDADGHNCGSKPTTGTGKSFRLQSLPGWLNVTFNLAATGRAGKAKPKTKLFAIGGTDLRCGKLVNLPPPEKLCDQSGSSIPNCGVATPGQAAWTTPITMSGDTISAGRVGSPSGNCRLVEDQHDKYSWFGYPLQLGAWLCADGIVASPHMLYLRLVRGDQICKDNVPQYLKGFFSFHLPPSWTSWAGQLQVAFNINIFDTKTQLSVGSETEARSFTLTGDQDGCPALMRG